MMGDFGWGTFGGRHLNICLFAYFDLKIAFVLSHYKILVVKIKMSIYFSKIQLFPSSFIDIWTFNQQQPLSSTYS